MLSALTAGCWSVGTFTGFSFFWTQANGRVTQTFTFSGDEIRWPCQSLAPEADAMNGMKKCNKIAAGNVSL